MDELYGRRRKAATHVFSTRELHLFDDPQEAPNARQASTSLARGQTELLLPCKAITLYPVWAWAIMHGPKRVENRPWPSKHRGPLAIHAGINRSTEPRDRAFIERLGLRLPHDVPGGVILGTIDLIGCQRYGGALKDDPWAAGPWCWILQNPRTLPEPIPASGKQSLWICQLPANYL